MNQVLTAMAVAAWRGLANGFTISSLGVNETNRVYPEALVAMQNREDPKRE